MGNEIVDATEYVLLEFVDDFTFIEDCGYYCCTGRYASLVDIDNAIGCQQMLYLTFHD